MTINLIHPSNYFEPKKLLDPNMFLESKIFYPKKSFFIHQIQTLIRSNSNVSFVVYIENIYREYIYIEYIYRENIANPYRCLLLPLWSHLHSSSICVADPTKNIRRTQFEIKKGAKSHEQFFKKTKYVPYFFEQQSGLLFLVLIILIDYYQKSTTIRSRLLLLEV